jgi:cytochrome b561
MERRYSSLNQAPHWITAGCMFAILPLAWVMTNMKPDAAYREDLFNWHKTLGRDRPLHHCFSRDLARL